MSAELDGSALKAMRGEQGEQVDGVTRWSLDGERQEVLLDSGGGRLRTMLMGPDYIVSMVMGGHEFLRVLDGERSDLAVGAPMWRLTSAGTRWIALGASDGQIGVVDTSDWKVHLKPAHRGVVDALASSSDGRVLATASGTDLRLWDLPGLEPRWQTDTGFTVTNLEILSDGRVFGQGGDGHVAFWSATGELEQSMVHGDSTAVEVNFSSDESVFFVASAHGFVALYDTEHSPPGPLGERTNLRVCRDTLEVVPVLPFPAGETVWAPPEDCVR
ncbi:MAG TPA: WD40 repeat domain-containing protein [Myxococcota bacterium]|nr:WD40 repeat domain-containing protein [Myxococcota bacterium]